MPKSVFMLAVILAVVVLTCPFLYQSKSGSHFRDFGITYNVGANHGGNGR